MSGGSFHSFPQFPLSMGTPVCCLRPPVPYHVLHFELLVFCPPSFVALQMPLPFLLPFFLTYHLFLALCLCVLWSSLAPLAVYFLAVSMPPCLWVMLGFAHYPLSHSSALCVVQTRQFPLLTRIHPQFRLTHYGFCPDIFLLFALATSATVDLID